MTMKSTSANYLHCANGATEELKVVGASYRPGGAGAYVAYTIVPWELGLILIGASAHGICWLGIHECAAYLESELCRDFPEAETARSDDALRDLAARVIGFIGGDVAPIYFPVDLGGTPFQLAVWRELCAIPRGTTRSYNEIAHRLGKPGGARAVGRANGSNPLAVLIPCHRAVGADGKLTGYRWGLEYKRRLLEYERHSLKYAPRRLVSLRQAQGCGSPAPLRSA
jgi:AraC family transcriptional regulator, regulatory protein of adaptative response / methylated-DNA-[protein]-cysteine methyltransferase